MRDRRVDIPSFQKLVAQIVVRHPATGIFRNRGLPQCFDVMITPALLPRAKTEHANEHAADQDKQQWLPGDRGSTCFLRNRVAAFSFRRKSYGRCRFEPSQRRYDASSSKSQRSHTCEVLKMIAYKRVTEEINAEEAKYREKRKEIIRRGKEGCASAIGAHEPESNHTSQQCEQWQPGDDLRWIKFPARINKN